jgi:uncharacterized protein (TIGR00369 family)
MKEIPLYPGCFVCGQENEIGLKARFYWDGEKAVCDVTATEAYAGYKNILHGGIIATLLDEIMIKALLAEGILSVTAEITVRLKKPVFSGDRLHLEGKKTKERGTVYSASGRMINQHGETVAEAVATYVKPGKGLGTKLSESRDDDNS